MNAGIGSTDPFIFLGKHHARAIEVERKNVDVKSLDKRTRTS